MAPGECSAPFQRAARSFTNNEVNFLQSVANVLGAAIDREKAEQEILRTNRAHRALSACNQALRPRHR